VPTKGWTAKGAVLAGLLLCGLCVSPASAQRIEPGGSSGDVNLAINKPHEYAWRLFLFLSQQAKSGAAGVPDPTKRSLREYNPDRDVVWETWAIATGGLFLQPGEQNTSEVYKDKGIKPVPWAMLRKKTTTPKRLEASMTELARVLYKGDPIIAVAPGVTVEGEVETRLNKSTYQTIRDRKLYSVEGLVSAFEKAKAANDVFAIKFELDSKVVKGKWVKLASEADKDRYHWRTIRRVDPSGQKREEIWGLSGLHITTKDLPQWFWTDFEHVDQEPKAIKEGRPSVDPTTRGPGALKGKNGIRNETFGSKWQYYRLRGVQLAFTDQFGRNTELANTLIEPIESGASSCITCHSKATISDKINHRITGRPFMINSLLADFVSGNPDPNAFQKDGVILYLQTDFLWSMAVRARSEKE
jgi:hypothetical protein